MSNPTYAVGGLAVITLFMIIALATVGLNAPAQTSQVAERAAVQSVG
ncbi:MAG TPA: hypothetical protein VG839_01085 [Asticcacaulis sp.]|nr:hypothetical protein [Asticcacaulis sp.]